MKKTLFITAFVLLCTALPLTAQTVIFEETFDSTPEGEVPANWETVDRSGTFVGWVVADLSILTDSYGFSGQTAYLLLYTASSDQLLVSPSISLQTGNSYSLTFLIGSVTVEGAFPPEMHYAVYVLPEADTFSGSETPVLEEDISVGDNAESKTIDLSSYAGQTVKIYFRQFDGPNTQGILMLDTVQVLEETLLGTSEVGSVSELAIYPNPVSDYLTVGAKGKINKVEIFDMSGRKMNADLDGNTIDVRKLSPGNYIINIETKEGKTSRKFIKK